MIITSLSIPSFVEEIDVDYVRGIAWGMQLEGRAND